MRCTHARFVRSLVFALFTRLAVMFKTTLLALNLFACTAETCTTPPRSVAPPDAVTFKLNHVGRLPRGPTDDPLDVQPSGVQLAYACCDFNGECYWVDMLSECPFPWDVYYCEWGVTNLDGTVDCYD